MANSIELSIIIPVYNEESSLRPIVEKILNEPLATTYEIILVNSGSTDGSTAVITNLVEKYQFKSIHIPKNRGKGFCIREGLKVAAGNIILIQDADLEYDPKDYNNLLQPILAKKTSFVLGSRHLGAGTWRIRTVSRKSLYFEIVNLGSEFLTKVFCLLYSVKLNDTQTMYKVFNKHLVSEIQFTCDGFDFDWELLSVLIQKGHIPTEIPVSYNSRTIAEGKKLRFFKDGFAALYTIIKYRFRHGNKLASGA